MKRFFVAAVICVSGVAWGQGTAQKPYYAPLPQQPINFDELMKELNQLTPPPDTREKLGPIDKWRYESCQTNAAKAPTSHGVNAGLRICREKFGQ